MSFDVFLCFTIPIVWILSALLAHRLFVRRGYPQSESWLPGCLLGPVGVFMAALMPHESPRGRYLLQFAGLFFAITVLSGVPLLLLRLAVKESLYLGLGLFIVFEVAIFFMVRRVLQIDKGQPAEDVIDSVQENVGPDSQL